MRRRNLIAAALAAAVVLAGSRSRRTLSTLTGVRGVPKRLIGR